MSEQVDHKVVIDSTPETINDGVDFKVDLANPPQKEETTEETVEEQTVEQPQEELQEKNEVEQPKTEDHAEQVQEQIEEASSKEESSEEGEEQEKVLEQVQNLPENIDKLVKFMEETGGTLEDYVALNKDYKQLDPETLLRSYYAATQPYLNDEEVTFRLQEFTHDEDNDSESDIRRKQIALKETIAKAEQHFENQKQQYYSDIKVNNQVAADPKMQEALTFFNRYEEQQQQASQRFESFKSKTNDLFNSDFKGFDFNVGENSITYKIDNPQKVAEKQSSIENFIGKFLDKEGNVTDHKGYHKAIYAAENADSIAKHFYEQGKADATRNITAQSKNIQDEAPRAHAQDVFINGLKVKAISGADSSKLRIKKR